MLKLAISIYLANTITQAFEYKNSSAASLHPYLNAAIDYSTPGSISNPAYLPLIDFSYINFSGSRPYSLNEISSINLKSGYSLKNSGIQIFWNRFGIDEYKENIIEGNIGYMPIKYFSAGTGLNYYNLIINTRELSFTTNQLDVKISALLIPFQWMEISFHQNNLFSILYKKRSDLLFPEGALGVSLKPLKGLSIIWNINRNAFGYVNSFLLSANLLKFLSIKLGYSKETTSYSASFSFVYKYTFFSYSFKFHPHLGITHSIGVTLASRHIQFNNLEYINRFKKRSRNSDITRININNCSLNELKKIPAIKENIAVRIIKYREIIGPVSKKSLIQIGLKQREVNNLLEYVYGLNTKKIQKKKYRKWSRFSRARKKKLFIKLLKFGIGASYSLKLSELASKGKEKQIFAEIDSIANIDREKKKKIKRLCIEQF